MPSERHTDHQEQRLLMEDGHHGNAAPHRKIFIGKPQPVKFSSNSVSTTKYNFFTFLPLFLFESFRRYSNAFFLFIALLQQIPDVSPTGRWTTLVPLSCILFVSACKEVFEDFNRWSADSELNNRKVCRYTRNGESEWIKWKTVQVGDILKVHNGEEFPADILLLSSSENGIAFIETANLDGETNLKTRVSWTPVAESDIAKLDADVECEQPNRHLYEFHGTIQLTGSSREALGPDNVLLRGSRLKNTEWIYGLVIYTGADTKLVQNSKHGAMLRLKRSQLDEFANHQIGFMFSLLLVLCFICGGGNYAFRTKNTHRHWYLTSLLETQNVGLNFLTFFILYNNLIPISLQVTLEMVRFFQTIFIGWDLDMYHEATDNPAIARTSNLNEDLGQVKYVFTDKTGTVTENMMIFRQCSVAGNVFGVAETESQRYEDTNLASVLSSGQRHPVSSACQEFLLALSLCHTVVPEKNSEDPSKPFYLASSPDELALVNFAAQMGYVFLKRINGKLTLEISDVQDGRKPQQLEFELLHVLEFDSDRKRMSVIVKFPNGPIVLYCKGADSIILERLAPEATQSHRKGSDEVDFIKKGIDAVSFDEPVNKKSLLDIAVDHLEEFAENGLRTLCVASAVLPAAEYESWREQYTKAGLLIEGRKEKMDELADQIEQNLHLLGCTAIEDRLQQGVPETIETLIRAGIKVWMLTGDKVETAINIGHSCNLLSCIDEQTKQRRSLAVYVIKETSLEKTRETIDRYRDELSRYDNLGKENMIGLVIDGKSLHFAMSAELRDRFVELAVSCKSVVCCRVSPMQKADVVSLIRSKFPKEITLAIGDGANDVAMIQTAHVGVGISGKEGTQAVCASDYAIGQFRFLGKLLLVHGAWSYERIAKMVCYAYYKNICLYIMQFFYTFLSCFSGQTMFERWTIGLYNLCFTAWPPIVLGLFDKSCDAKIRLKYPYLYSFGQQGKLFNYKVFWIWILTAIFHSVIIFGSTYFFFNNDVLLPSGLNHGGFAFGAAAYTYVIVVVCLKASLEMSSWTRWSAFFIFGSIIAWFAFMPFYSRLWPHFLNFGEDFVGIDEALFHSWNFWAALILVPILTLFADLSYKIVRNTVSKPNLQVQIHQIRKAEKRGLVQGDYGTPVRTEKNRGFAFSQDESKRQSARIMTENTDTRQPDRLARVSRHEEFGSASRISVTVPIHGSPRSAGRKEVLKTTVFATKEKET